MNTFVIVGLLSAVLVYIIVAIVYINTTAKRKKAIELMEVTPSDKRFKTFGYEEKILRQLKVEPDKVKAVLLFERTIIIALAIFGFSLLKGLMLAAIGAIVIVIISDDAYKKVLYDSGITNINRVTNFINYFVPHINSGNSANQSLLGYIEYSKDDELLEYYENIDNPQYETPSHLKQVTEIYEIAKYNEEMGMADYTYILNELSQDIAQKQVYYNSFISRIGEIKPIMWSYYAGVPILIAISYKQTGEFWQGLGGIAVAAVLLLFFGIFKFLIYKLQKNTINAIF